jgi:hypothetical protein
MVRTSKVEIYFQKKTSADLSLAELFEIVSKIYT